MGYIRIFLETKITSSHTEEQINSELVTETNREKQREKNVGKVASSLCLMTLSSLGTC